MKQLPAGWKETTLGDIVEIVGWWTPKTSEPQYWNWNIPWLSVVDFNNDNRRVYYTEKTITEEGLKNSSTKILNEWDLIISARWTVWALAQLKRDMAFNQSCYGIKQLDGVSDKNFLFYLLKNSISFLSRNVHWAVFDTITRETFDIIPIHLPPLPEQQAIAAVLSSFDDKIELLRAENQTLEQMGQELFKERFGKWKVGDELPQGWRVGKLGEEFDVSIGRTPPRAESEWFSNKPIGKKWISIKDMVNSWIYIFNTSEFLTDEAIAKFNIPIIPNNTTILSFKMTVGKLAITTEDMLSNEAIAHFKLKSNSLLSSEFIYCYLSNLDFNSLWSTSSIVTAINSTIIKELSCIIPDQETLSKFDLVIKPLFNKIRANSEQIQTLSSTRDQLLPKLMSGEVRVEF